MGLGGFVPGEASCSALVGAEEVEVVETSDSENCAFVSVVLSGCRESVGVQVVCRGMTRGDLFPPPVRQYWRSV